MTDEEARIVFKACWVVDYGCPNCAKLIADEILKTWPDLQPIAAEVWRKEGYEWTQEG